MPTRKPANTRIVVDFSNTEIGGGGSGAHLPEGRYRFAIKSAERKRSQSGNLNLNFKMEVVSGKQKGRFIYHNCSLQEQALFNLRGLLTACGIKTPKSKYAFDSSKLIGRQFEADVVDDEYNDKIRSKIDTFVLPGQEEEEDDEDEEEEDEDEEDEDEDDEDEEEDEPPVKKKASAKPAPAKKPVAKAKPARKARRAKDDDDDEDLDEIDLDDL